MIFPSNRVRILVATKPVDFRKGHDGLAALVQSVLLKGLELVYQGVAPCNTMPLLTQSLAVYLSHRVARCCRTAHPQVWGQVWG